MKMKVTFNNILIQMRSSITPIKFRIGILFLEVALLLFGFASSPANRQLLDQ